MSISAITIDSYRSRTKQNRKNSLGFHLLHNNIPILSFPANCHGRYLWMVLRVYGLLSRIQIRIGAKCSWSPMWRSMWSKNIRKNRLKVGGSKLMGTNRVTNRSRSPLKMGHRWRTRIHRLVVAITTNRLKWEARVTQTR